MATDQQIAILVFWVLIIIGAFAISPILGGIVIAFLWMTTPRKPRNSNIV